MDETHSPLGIRGGEKNMKEYAKGFYKSKAWKSLRESYLKSVGGLCERCLKQGMYNPAVIVHHKDYIDPENISDPNITLSAENLEALCQTHHNREHKGSVSRYVIDSMGKVSALE